jgi:zinc protease
MNRFARVLTPALFAITAFTQTLPSGVQKKASMGGITEYDFPNGLKVLLYPDAANPQITVNVTYLVGSRHEGYGETGMAHLLEHLDFIETTNGRQIKNEITAHATNWNGTTSYDRTNYYETIPATDENLKWALGLEADRMANVKFTQQILDTEMTVVRNEFERGENSPQSILRERVEATAYLWHNYGKSTIGSKDDLEHVPVARPAAFYHKYYRPDNAVLVLTGRLDEAKTLQFVAETFGKLPRPAQPVEQTYTIEPPQDGERFVELRRVGQGQEVILAYHGPAAAHPDSVALQVLAGIMNGASGGGRGGRGGRGGGGGGENEGRLSKALVDAKLAQSASMGERTLHDPGLITLTASLNKDQSLDAAKKAMIDALAGVINNPPTKEEVDRVRTGLLRGLERNLANPQQIATGALNEAIAQGDWRLMFLQHDRLEDISPSDVLRVAQAYFKESNLTVGYYIPDSAPDRTVVPATPNLESLLGTYKSGVTIVHAEVFDPSPANIESRLSRTKLANGMKVVILPKKTENNNVDGTIELRFGDANTLKGQTLAAGFASALIMRGGTKKHTRAEIQDELRKLDATVNVGGGGGGGGRGGRGGRGGGGGGAISSLNATIAAPANNFVAALRIAAEIMREPAYPPESDFETMRTERIKGLELAPTEPTQLAAETLQRHLSPWVKGDVLYDATREEQIVELKKLTYADVKRFHDQFYGANSGVFAVVGPVDAPAIQKVAGELFGDWNTSMTYRPIAAEYKKVPAINVKIETPDKANAQFEASERFAMSDNDPDYPGMLLAAYMFGGPITSHVSDRIRNREGLSYGANARAQIPAEGNAAMLTATVSLNPVNGPKVEFSYMDELKRTLKEGFTPAEFASSKKAYLESRNSGRAQDAGLLNLIAAHELQGRTMKWDADLEARIQSLTLEQVNAAFRAHIDPAAVSIVKAGDFKAAGVYK